MSSSDRGILRLYRFLLHLLPSRLRGLRRAEMEYAFEQMLYARSPDSGWIGGFRILMSEGSDLVKTGLRLRLGGGRGAPQRGHGGLGGGKPGRGLRQDIQVAFRQVRRSSGFSAVVILTMAIGIGATTAIFSILNTVVLAPLPFPESDNLVSVWLSNVRQGIERDVTSYPNFADWRAENTSFEEMAAIWAPQVTLTGEGTPVRVRGAAVTEGFFPLIGVAPALGRPLRDTENQIGAPPTVVISHRLWVEMFGSDLSVLGTELRIDRVSHEIVGVMPPGIAYPLDADLWRPFQLVGVFEEGDLPRFRGALNLPIIGRLRADVPLVRAQAEMTEIAGRLEDLYPINAGMGINLESLKESVVGDTTRTLTLLMGAVAFVLLIACANLANLFLSKGSTRTSEIALRRALGAGAGRILRLSLVESCVLGSIGGLVGLALAFAGLTVLQSSLSLDIPRIEQVAIDLPVLFFAFAATLLASLLFGVVPALQSIKIDPQAAMKQNGSRGSSSRGFGVRRYLVISQVSLAVVLLIGAGLMMRSMSAIQSVDSGMDSEGVLTFRISLPEATYPTPERIQEFWDRLMADAVGVPGVESIAATSTLLLPRLTQAAPVRAEGGPENPQGALNFPVAFDIVTEDFFNTLGIDVVSGRTFQLEDQTDSTLVAVVNEAFVRRYLGHTEALSGRFTFDDADAEEPTWVGVVGVVADVRRSGLDQPVRPAAYFPYPQNRPRSMTVAVRGAGAPLSLLQGLQATTARIDSELPLSRIESLDQALSSRLSTRRLLGTLLGLFAAIAITLAAVGIYGVTSYQVSSRSRELGIQLALGAGQSRVLSGVMKGTGIQIGVGLIIGLVAAVLLGRVIEGLIYGVRITDPATFAAVVLALGVVALVSAGVPAIRASRLNPADTLRRE